MLYKECFLSEYFIRLGSRSQVVRDSYLMDVYTEAEVVCAQTLAL
jgi:hypothetical protein